MSPHGGEMRLPDGVEAGERPDRATLQKIKDILNLLNNAVAAMKIFPSHHENVLKIVGELFGQLTAYLDEHVDLEIHVEENAFIFRGEEVFKDPNTVKSLPYLFFKDGMESFNLTKGLAREELGEFLEIIKMNIILPPEKGDIVDSLWEREFLHIRYYAPDEFLETKIGQGQGLPYDYRVDRASLYKGKIELSEADMRDVMKASLALGQRKDSAEAPAIEDLAANLDKSESMLLDSMLSTERRYPGQKEFLDLFFEVLYLEQRPAVFLDLLGRVDGHHRHLLQAQDLASVLYLLDMLTSLRSTLHYEDPGRESLVAEALKKTLEGMTVEVFQATLRVETADPRLFYEYLRRLGKRLLPYALEIFETMSSPEWRAAGYDALRDISLIEMSTLANMAQDKKPALTKAIIRLMASRPDRKSILQLASFINYTNPEIKEEAVEALGAIANNLANKVLIEFLHDPSERVRVKAARLVRLEWDPRALETTGRLVGEKEFQDRVAAEKKAFFDLLARSGEKMAVDALRAVIERTGFFGKAKQEETRLYAAQALATMRSPEAVEELKVLARHSNKKIAQISKKALAGLAAAESGRPGE